MSVESAIERTEAVDPTLRDLRNSNKFMDGITITFAGDFRQILS